MASFSTEILIWAGVSFFLAGWVKGLIGLGFPTIILAMLSFALGVREAIALMLFPCFATNLWQAISGGYLSVVVRRIWPLYVLGFITTLLATSLLVRLDSIHITRMFGAIIALYGLCGVFHIRLKSPGKYERLFTPAAGLVTGVITGLTGTFVIPAVLYLQSLKLPRDMLIQAMGLHFLVITLALTLGFAGHSLLNQPLAVVSGAALIPAFLGMASGRAVRRRIPENRFERFFFFSLLVIGCAVVIRTMITGK